MVMYISWSDCHSDKVEVVGSSPTMTTNKKLVEIQPVYSFWGHSSVG